jgi:RNA polymerase sigma-70 factor, ECF subfamily
MSSVPAHPGKVRSVSTPPDDPLPAGTDAGPAAELAAAQLSDDEFVRELIVRFGRGLSAFVIGLTGDRDRAEDIVQLTLIRAWRSRDKLAGSGDSARTWLYTVARHLVIDDYRARSARPVLLTSELHAVEQSNDTDCVTLSVAIDQALATLTEAQRPVVRYVLLQHRTTAEVARILRVAEGTVRSRLHYGMQALRKALDVTQTSRTHRAADSASRRGEPSWQRTPGRDTELAGPVPAPRRRSADADGGVIQVRKANSAERVVPA